MLQFKSREEVENHFNLQGEEFDGLYNTKNDYLAGAHYVIKYGTYVSEMNGYLKFFGAEDKANYAFVGLTQNGGNITVFGVRSISKLTQAPCLS